MSHILCWLLQVEDVCKTLAGFPELKHGYNAIGFSQGRPLLLQCVSLTLPPALLASAQTLASTLSILNLLNMTVVLRATAAGLARMTLLITMHYFAQVVSS